MKKYKMQFAISTLISALPIVLVGEGQRWIPLLMTTIHMIVTYFVVKENEKRDQSEKVMNLMFWLVPIISWFTCLFVYMYEKGMVNSSSIFVTTLVGIIFLLTGNFIPKAKRNRSIGVRVTWAMKNEENWYHTHRVAGKVFWWSGLVILFAGFLPLTFRAIVLGTLMPVVILIPILYSYFYYRKQKKAGTYTEEVDTKNSIEISSKLAIVITVAVLTLVGVLLISGDVTATVGETELSIETAYWDDMEIAYDSITAIEYRETFEAGSREAGFGSFKLGLGYFSNEEFERYVRYCYEECDSCIILHTKKEVFVLNQETAEATKVLYEQLKGKVK